ncbi:hypothetical protein OAE77_00680, partial [bacterium]|nr:hypothetical protein [bacterium]
RENETQDEAKALVAFLINQIAGRTGIDPALKISNLDLRFNPRKSDWKLITNTFGVKAVWQFALE